MHEKYGGTSVRSCMEQRIHRTYALGPSMVDCPSAVARLALRNAVHGTCGAGLRHAVIAYANVLYKIITYAQSAVQLALVRVRVC